MRQLIKNLLNKRLKNEKGLTLVELLAVIVILGIIAAIAVPAIGNIINDSEIKAVKANALNILNAANLYVTQNPDIDTITHVPAATGNSKFTETADKGTVGQFEGYIQSLGSFSSSGFTITNTNGKVTLTATGTDNAITAGGKTISFNGAGIDDIDASNADSNTGTTTGGTTTYKVTVQ
ncbi:Type IV pilus assembly protein PilA OS=Ureibacillus acetophenoni OX=614649 GN=SAMN05877842_10474 PE=4 SV=1 [Ureibacillus acetophenoni]